MVSSDGTQADSNTIFGRLRAELQGHAQQRVESEQIFQLIDTILPFEACLYHQFLPIVLTGNDLLLGMVNTEDSAALEYASRIASYLNYSLQTHPLTTETHRQLLSAYLNYTGKAQLRSQSPSTAVKSSVANSASPTEDSNNTENNQKSTFILDSTEALSLPWIEPPRFELPEDTSNQLENHLSVDNTTVTSPGAALPSDLGMLPQPATHQPHAVAKLATLPPPQLLTELLARVLASGIGRLYFERQQQQGRILWSENGVLQSVVEDLPISLFAELITELKQLANLPLHNSEEMQQIEIERLYQQQPIILRVRILPGMAGEEATLQVLQGAALKFHQHQQLGRSTQDAWEIAQQLSQKIQHLHKQVLTHKSLNPSHREDIKTLQQLLTELAQQLQELTLTTTSDNTEL